MRNCTENASGKSMNGSNERKKFARTRFGSCQCVSGTFPVVTGAYPNEADPNEAAIVQASTPGPADALGDDARALYNAIPADGTTRANRTIREALGWENEETADRYFSARDRLEDAGLVVRGRGRGGTIRRAQAKVPPAAAVDDGRSGDGDAPEEVIEVVANSIRRELDLYDPLYKVINSEWARDHRSDPIAVEITAQQGRRATGIWARPDIVSIEIRAFDYVPGKFVEVTTFEVKPSDAISVQAVYEALAHRRAATHSYVLVHVPAEQRDDLEAAVYEVCDVARGHGIGVIIVESPDDYETWEEREVAVRVEPDPDQLDAFIGRQLSEEAQRKIRVQLR
jgi:hypothetical protein